MVECVVTSSFETRELFFQAARQGADQLRQVANRLPSASKTIVIEVDGVRFEVPQAVLQGVVDVLETVITDESEVGDTVGEMTPQQAADALGMSRPSVMRLLAKGLLSSRLVGAHHRLIGAEVLNYKVRHSAARKVALQNIADITEEYGF